MRPALLGCCLIVALGLPKVGNAQVSYRPTPAPLVTAAGATWQINGEPLFFAGWFYYPTGPVVFFDGQLMTRVGEYRKPMLDERAVLGQHAPGPYEVVQTVGRH